MGGTAVVAITVEGAALHPTGAPGTKVGGPAEGGGRGSEGVVGGQKCICPHAHCHASLSCGVASTRQ